MEGQCRTLSLKPNMSKNMHILLVLYYVLDQVNNRVNLSQIYLLKLSLILPYKSLILSSLQYKTEPYQIS